MSGLTMTLLGADGSSFTLIGDGQGAEGVKVRSGQLHGTYYAPVQTEWTRARRQRGGTLKLVERPWRDMTIGFKVERIGSATFAEVSSRLHNAIPYERDRWDPAAQLAKLAVEADDSYRTVDIQQTKEPEFAPDMDPTALGQGTLLYTVRAAQPFWESTKDVTAWETSGTSGSGTIPGGNPTDVEMYHFWQLSPGTWTVPDFSWTGPARARVPGGKYGTRTITLKPVTTAMQSLTIDLDPMHVMMQSAAGTNVMGEVGAGYYFLHTIPPHTPPTDLPISVTGAPAGGARAELHQPRLWSNCYGGN